MKTWKRGRNPVLTDTEREEARQWQNERVKIANMVARKPEIQKICCICGKPGNILHNRQDPYFITFICDECKKDPKNLEIAEDMRIDLRTLLKNNGLRYSNFLDEDIIEIVRGYLTYTKSIGVYCDSLNISRHQFNKMIDRYCELFPNDNIRHQIKDQSNNVQTSLLNKRMELKKILG